MISNDLLELIKKRRSVRKWLDKPVDEKELQKILLAGVYAPSAANCQKTRLYVIKNKKILEDVANCTSPWFIGNYPAKIIVVLFDLAKPNPLNININKPHHAWSRFIWQDTSAAIMNMMLMAEVLGLKTCWVSIGPPQLGDHEQRVRRLLNISNRYILTGFLFLGHSNRKIDINTFKHQGLPIKRNEGEIILETLK